MQKEIKLLGEIIIWHVIARTGTSAQMGSWHLKQEDLAIEALCQVFLFTFLTKCFKVEQFAILIKLNISIQHCYYVNKNILKFSYKFYYISSDI